MKLCLLLAVLTSALSASAGTKTKNDYFCKEVSGVIAADYCGMASVDMRNCRKTKVEITRVNSESATLFSAQVSVRVPGGREIKNCTVLLRDGEESAKYYDINCAH